MSSNENEKPWWVPLHQDNCNPVVGSGFAPVDLGYESKRRRTRMGEVSFFLALSLAVVSGVAGGVVGELIGSQSHSLSYLNSKTVIERPAGSVAHVAAKLTPSVVSISVRTSRQGDTGSGFFITSDGYILTNNHVINSAKNNNGEIVVTVSAGKKYIAKIIGSDAAHDLAVIKINVSQAPVVPIGNSSKVLVGDTVLAFGSPLGLTGTVTSGIISAKNRAVTAGADSGVESAYINALQTDAAINPGNSGGPLVDISGSVIGVNSAIASLGGGGGIFGFNSQTGSIGLGFAIPINQAMKFADQLIKNGFVTYPLLGVKLDSAFQGGAKIISTPDGVSSGSSANLAGIKPGDVILSIDENKISDAEDAILAIRAHEVGDVIKVLISRDNKEITFSVKLLGDKNSIK